MHASGSSASDKERWDKPTLRMNHVQSLVADGAESVPQQRSLATGLSRINLANLSL